MPAPMPREAPVTRATLPARVGKGRAGGAAWPFVGPFVCGRSFMGSVGGAPLPVVSGMVAASVLGGVEVVSGMVAASVLGGVEVVSGAGSGAPLEREGAEVVVVGLEVTGRGVRVCSLEVESMIESGYCWMFVGQRRIGDEFYWRFVVQKRLRDDGNLYL